LIPGPWDYDLSRRRMLDRMSHPGILMPEILKGSPCILKNQGESILVEVSSLNAQVYFSL